MLRMLSPRLKLTIINVSNETPVTVAKPGSNWALPGSGSASEKRPDPDPTLFLPNKIDLLLYPILEGKKSALENEQILQ